MSDPLICCICLDPGGRPDFIERARKCFYAQGYPNKHLVVYSTGEHGNVETLESCEGHRVSFYPESVHVLADREQAQYSVGKLRNISIGGFCPAETEYIAHFDWDDWSAPDRLSRQLAHIQKTGKLVAGFYDMPMYETIHDKVYMYRNVHKEYALGTSLFYRREAWERVKFPDETPEDNKWRRDVGFENCESQSSLREDGSPIMIQVIHGANASARIIRGGTYFKEADEAQAKAVRDILASA